MITIYGRPSCPFCEAAKGMCQTLGAEYEYKLVSDVSEEHEKLVEKYNHHTVPLIMVNGTFIGGFTEFQQAHKSGKLKELLG